MRHAPASSGSPPAPRHVTLRQYAPSSGILRLPAFRQIAQLACRVVRHTGQTSGPAFSGILRHWRSSGTHVALYPACGQLQQTGDEGAPTIRQIEFTWHSGSTYSPGKPEQALLRQSKAFRQNISSGKLGSPAEITLRAWDGAVCSGKLLLR